jgi:hypothetical protein
MMLAPSTGIEPASSTASPGRQPPLRTYWRRGTSPSMAPETTGWCTVGVTSLCPPATTMPSVAARRADLVEDRLGSGGGGAPQRAAAPSAERSAAWRR